MKMLIESFHDNSAERSAWLSDNERLRVTELVSHIAKANIFI